MNKEQLVMKSPQKETKGDSNRLAEADHKVLGVKLTEIICHKASFKHLLRGKEREPQGRECIHVPLSVICGSVKRKYAQILKTTECTDPLKKSFLMCGQNSGDYQRPQVLDLDLKIAS